MASSDSASEVSSAYLLHTSSQGSDDGSHSNYASLSSSSSSSSPLDSSEERVVATESRERRKMYGRKRAHSEVEPSPPMPSSVSNDDDDNDYDGNVEREEEKSLSPPNVVKRGRGRPRRVPNVEAASKKKKEDEMWSYICNTCSHVYASSVLCRTLRLRLSADG